MSIRFVRNHPALLITDNIKKKRKILVVADLHLGLEHELFASGIVISPQAEKFQKEFDKLIRMTKADTLIILGDLKHKVPGISFRELREVPKLLEHLMKRVNVIVTKGNHDDFIEKLVPRGVKVYSSRGFKIKGKFSYGFFHGHAWPSKALMKCDYLFMAHSHPGIEFKDKFGFRIVEPVWVKSELKKEIVAKKYKLKTIGKLQTIILPTFNPILGGIPLNKGKEYIGPLLSSKAFYIPDATAYLLDGTELGKIKRL